LLAKYSVINIIIWLTISKWLAERKWPICSQCHAEISGVAYGYSACLAVCESVKAVESCGA